MSRDADVLIVGAGIIGCAVARELAAGGARVEVVDPRAIAGGATQASAGMLAPYIEAHEGGLLFDLTVRSLDLYDAWIAAVRAESGIDVEYRRSGSLEVALDRESEARLRDAATRSGPQGPLFWLDPADARIAAPGLSNLALGGLSVPIHGYVSAAPLTDALAQCAASSGARFHIGSRVVRLRPQGDHVVVESEDKTTWRAERVVVAAGSWTGQLEAPGATEGVRPIRGQLLRVAWRGQPLSQVVWGPRCYLVPWHDGTVLIGATMEDAGFDERNTLAGVRGLLEAATDLFPHAGEATFLEARSGLRPATRDGLPIIGASQSSDRIIYATGHYRNGIMLAPLTAKLVAELIQGRADPVLEALRPERFQRAAVP